MEQRSLHLPPSFLSLSSLLSSPLSSLLQAIEYQTKYVRKALLSREDSRDGWKYQDLVSEIHFWVNSVVPAYLQCVYATLLQWITTDHHHQHLHHQGEGVTNINSLPLLLPPPPPPPVASLQPVKSLLKAKLFPAVTLPLAPLPTPGATPLTANSTSTTAALATAVVPLMTVQMLRKLKLAFTSNKINNSSNNFDNSSNNVDNSNSKYLKQLEANIGYLIQEWEERGAGSSFTSPASFASLTSLNPFATSGGGFGDVNYYDGGVFSGMPSFVPSIVAEDQIHQKFHAFTMEDLPSFTSAPAPSSNSNITSSTPNTVTARTAPPQPSTNNIGGYIDD